MTVELPCRAQGDVLLRPGELVDIRRRLRGAAREHDLRAVIVCAFDHRTRMLPFLLADTRMAPAGVRAIGSALADSGFPKTRIVLQQWNRHFRPSQMRLDGRVPDLFCVSSMTMHAPRAEALIRDAWRIDPAHRPLIVAGGSKSIYEPWDFFGVDPQDPWGADVAVTGEEYVLLNLLEVLLSVRAGSEPMRQAFARARDGGLLDDVPGLVYARGRTDGVAEELVDTGIQRLVGDLDELPDPVPGYALLEAPSLRTGLASRAMSARRVRRYSPVASVVLTLGCKFRCPYCPIPAYNQRQFRTKSGERISEDIERLYGAYHLSVVFGADDFLNDRQRALGIIETLARKAEAGSRSHLKLRLMTEATVHDVLRMKEHLPRMRTAGVWGFWMGVEDMSGALIKKGQTADNTAEAFRLLRESGIFPMPMMMHHDAQPLYTRRSADGLLNQVRLLRKAGAIGLQVLMITPSVGSKLHDEAFTTGLALKRAGGRRVEQHMLDGNYVVATHAAKPWHKQLNLLAAYLYFYNPLRFLVALVRPKSRVPLRQTDLRTRASAPPPRQPRRSRLWRRIVRRMRDPLIDPIMQLFGMWGLSLNIRRTLGWGLLLRRGRIDRYREVPGAHVPMRDPTGGPACHDASRREATAAVAPPDGTARGAR